MGAASQSSPGPSHPVRAQLSPESLIDGACRPLHAALAALPAIGPAAGALRMIFRALGDLSGRLGGHDRLPAGHVRVHAWLLDRPDLSYEACFDGTLVAAPATWRVSHRRWTVERDQAALLIEKLAERWPGALSVTAPGVFSGAWPSPMLWI